jgi:tricorn protease interacting factor F2/3
LQTQWSVGLSVKSYDLFLDIDFKKLSFNGRVTIELTTEKHVVLNCLGLNVKKVEADSGPVGFQSLAGELVLHTGPFGGRLTIEYSGSVSDELVGLYRAPYDGTYLLSTQLEAAHARQLFPCVDHPDYKAEFRLSLRIDGDLDAISNMPVESVHIEGEKKTILFMKTPRMSTYLLYVGVGRFEELKEKVGGLDIIAATTPGKADGGRFALGIAEGAIPFYEGYFGIPFSLPKVHLVSVPEFAMGAMENWGAITFRETAFQAREGSSLRTQKRVAEVVAHELAHMWFGDLVTFRWWNDLWLNESFATFMEYKAVDNAFPQWRLWEDFLRDETTQAMALDSLMSTHPIEVDVKSPDEIEQIFDDISYSKGASIIRMIEEYLGAEAFRKGIGLYLNRHRFANATGDDLWDSLEASSGKPVRTIMKEWIRRPGYPVIHVKHEGGLLKLRQERFLFSSVSDKETWPVPIALKLNGEISHFLMSGETETIPIEDLRSIVVNVGRTGFYRVLYEGLEDLVWQDGLSPAEKWGMISDGLAFLLAGKISIGDYQGTLQRFYGCVEALPAQEASNQLALLCLIAPSRFREYSRQFHLSQLKLLEGKTDENSMMFHGVVAKRLSMVDDSYAVELGSRFANFGGVGPNLKEAVLVAHARASADFDSILAMYRRSGSDEEKIWLINSMMSFKDPAQVRRSFELAATGDVKRQDVVNMLLAAAGNPDARDVAWEWLKANLGRLNELYRGTGVLARAFTSIIPILGLHRSEEVEGFFRENPLPEADSGINAGIEKLRIYDRLARGLPST